MIRCRDVDFSYPRERFRLAIADLAVAEGESVALIGPSGCGKTTLLNLVAGIYLPDRGSIEVAGETVSGMPAQVRQRFRVANMGLVPQNFELLDYLTVRENIALPYRVSGALAMSDEVDRRGAELAERSGIAELLDRYPGRLSQGERQRTALCRGLIASPRLILADEPTGNLDPENQEKVVSLMLDEARRIGATVVMITHEPTLLPRFDRVVDVLELRKEANA